MPRRFQIVWGSGRVVVLALALLSQASTAFA